MPLFSPKTIIDIFKLCKEGFEYTDEWIKEHDFFGRAAQKYAEKIQERYNVIKIIGMSEPRPLRSIYTRVNILEKITARIPKTLDELEKYLDFEGKKFGIDQETLSGIDVVNEHQRFIILGKPGAGKTTFLKYICLKAIDSEFENKRIPVFIGLKDFSDSNLSLKNYIIEQFEMCNFPKAEPFVERLLLKGKCLLLFDGLDEVSNEEINKVISQIIYISEKYGGNQFIISCRIAAYNYCFEKFTDVEIADFDDEQIANFINNWFGKESDIAKKCWNKLNQNKNIRELATIPLLLTMLCLAFEGILDFPANKAELYKESVDALLKKWDASRRIERENVYEYLSLKRKESLFGRIAKLTFEKNQYLFQKRNLEKYISNYIQHFPEVKNDEIDIDSNSILKSIESQHGLFVERAKNIYSFSHLTFHEYFTAKHIVDNSSKGTLQKLIKNHLADNRWREVFLIITEILDEADDFLLMITKDIDLMVKNRENKFLKSLLGYLDNNIIKKTLKYPKEICRATSMYYIIASTSSIIKSPDISFASNCSLELAHVLGLSTTLACEIVIDKASDKAFELAQRLKIKTSDSVVLRNYVETNKLLIDCLNSDCFITKQTRNKILHDILTIQ